MRLFKSGSLVLTILLTAGCIKASKTLDGVNGPDVDNSGATFLITKGDGGTIPSSKDAQGRVVQNADGSQHVSNWNIPFEQNYMFEVCVQDRATFTRAAGHRFQVETTDVSHRRVASEDILPTDPEGCFTWIETIPFSFFVKRTKWVEIERDIVGTGVHTGRQRVKFAINPWIGTSGEDHGKAVVYMRNANLPKEDLVSAKNANAALSGDLLGPAELYIEDVNVQTLRRAEGDMGTMFRMNISMEPVVHVQSSAGLVHSGKLYTGDFDVIAHLVLAQTGPAFKDHLILTSFGESTVSDLAAGKMDVMAHGRVIDGKLIAHIDAWSNVQMPQGNLQVVLKVIPRGVRGLTSFEGIYDLGSEKSLAAGGKGDLTEGCRQTGISRSWDAQPEGCSIASYLRSSANFQEKYQEQLKEETLEQDCNRMTLVDLDKDKAKRAQCQEISKNSARDITRNSPYLFDRMNLRFVQVDDHETTMQRWVDYTVSTCVTDRFTGERVVGMKFNIRYEDTGEVIHTSTLEDGCLNWSSKIFHKYYQPEQYLRKTVSIEKDTGFKRELTFRINPWDDKFTFGFDERQFNSEFWAKQDARKKIRSRFFLSDFGYHTVRFQYNIDQLMNLEVRKTVLMELDPRVLRYSGIINARKMTEGLRDGIWLMKVAIQKNYLDPATVGVSIDALKDDQSVVRLDNTASMSKERAGEELNRRLDSVKLLRELNIKAPSREFISTQTALVRSTDGVVIQPVELKMQDLRMMRVRSNFLVELQAVDETKLQVHNQLDSNFNKYLDQLMNERRAKEEQRRLNANQGLPNTEDPAAEAKKEQDLRAKVEKRKDLIKRIFDYLVGLRYPISSAKTSLQDFKLSPDDQKFVDDSLNGSLDTLGIEDIDKALVPNNFIEIQLPSCQDVDCDALAAGEEKDVQECLQNSPKPITPEQDAKCKDLDFGLNRRTFVGPVIFLSNGYRDSVRATDNLDEAMCGKAVDIVDPVEAQFSKMERQLFATTEQKMQKERQNTIYRFSEYFGSLRHLCYVQVDSLIAREKENRKLYDDNIEALSSVYNFVSNFKMNFLSLADERPKAVELSADSLKRCNNNLVSCMHETEDHRFPLQEALNDLNSNLSRVKPYFFSKWFNSDIPKSDPWNIDDIRNALFAEDRPTSPASRQYAACVLLSGSVMHDLRMKDLELHPNLEDRLISECMYSSNSIVYDQKLRVFETGETGDSYMFLGGFQVNLNVGQSFSVSRSSSSSWSWGVEGADFIGAGGSFVNSRNPFFFFIKPVSAKVGQSQSLGTSDGTSVSDSTYLVAQIAKFRVRLDKYEKCVALHYSPGFEQAIRSGLGLYKMPYFETMELRGLFICDGQINRNQRFVDEKYFYFTQHFTEGDMLDQADLYNHPWLLALRGQRDFETFVGLMRAQEATSMWDFAKSVFHPTFRQTEWPLAHMRDAYKQITPTFPGYYTVLSEDEKGPDFPLEEKRLKRDDDDLNHEVINNPDLMQDRRSEMIHSNDNNQ